MCTNRDLLDKRTSFNPRNLTWVAYIWMMAISSFMLTLLRVAIKMVTLIDIEMRIFKATSYASDRSLLVVTNAPVTMWLGESLALFPVKNSDDQTLYATQQQLGSMGFFFNAQKINPDVRPKPICRYGWHWVEVGRTEQMTKCSFREVGAATTALLAR